MDERKILKQYVRCNIICRILAILITLFLVAGTAIFIGALLDLTTKNKVPTVIYIFCIVCFSVLISMVIFGRWAAHRCYKLQLLFSQMENIKKRTQLVDFLKQLREQEKEIGEQLNAANDFIFNDPERDDTIYQINYDCIIKYEICSDFLFYDGWFKFLFNKLEEWLF